MSLSIPFSLIKSFQHPKAGSPIILLCIALAFDIRIGYDVRDLSPGAKFMSLINVTLREDIDPDPDFYYHQQFKIYQEPYLIWDRDTWEAVLFACRVYRIEIDGGYGGDVLLEGRGEGIKYIVDFSILPEYQGKGVGKAVLEQIKTMAKKLTAVTRKETLHFFLKSRFVLKRTIKNYYRPGVHGYYISFETRAVGERVTGSKGQSSGNQDPD